MYLMSTHKHTQRGFTLVEMVIASAIMLLVATFLASLLLFSAKSERVLGQQATGQLNATRAMQSISDLMRNSNLTTIALVVDDQGTTRTITYASSELPSGQEAKIVYISEGNSEGDPDVGEVKYYPDKTATSFRTLAKGLEGIVFGLPGGQMVGIQVTFAYRKYKGRDQGDADRLNGTFFTRIFPRNP